LTAVNPDQTTGKAKDLLSAVKAKLGMAPNMMRTMANSPAVLEGYLNFNAALGGGELPTGLREQIALAVAEANSCEYCLSAHTALGKMAGLKPEQVSQSRDAAASDPKADAALKFAVSVVNSRGAVTDAEFSKVRAAGFSEGEVAEILAHVAINVFTNYFNKAALTVVDFPKVEARRQAA
jgi:uncharacterized peroxidase-related enzyme